MEQTLSNTLKDLSLDDTYILVVAIDFGTTFSGYAFSFYDKQKEILMNKNWGAESNCASYKSPTCVMTNPDGSFHSFGYQAETNYSQLDSENEVIGGSNGYNLYRHFKMALNAQNLTVTSTIKSTAGYETPAIDIFTMVLSYLRDHVRDAINLAYGSDSDFLAQARWVLTVPAIWSDEAKGFMREAAFKAGLIEDRQSRKLLIALEPEAASIFCQNGTSAFIGQRQEEDSNFKPGEKVLVIDAGGGTVDITAHELLDGGNVEEISSPSGGPWGGTQVDKRFIKLITRILGPDYINHFIQQNPQNWFNFITSFEKQKKSLKPDGKSSLRIQLPYGFDNSVKEKLDACKEASFSSGFMVIKHAEALALFSEAIGNIIEHVKDLIEEDNLNLNYILLVGGFAESPILQQACFDAFSDRVKVMVPFEAQLAIIKGAVMFGHNPVQIKSRIARVTYGTESRTLFKEGIHDPRKKITDKKGTARCKDFFSVFVRKGERLKTGVSKTFSYGKAYEDQKEMHFDIYKTDQKEVKYIDEEGVTKVKSAVLTSSKGKLGKTIETKVTFGHTELCIQARDKSEGDDFSMTMSVDFTA